MPVAQGAQVDRHYVVPRGCVCREGLDGYARPLTIPAIRFQLLRVARDGRGASRELVAYVWSTAPSLLTTHYLFLSA
eukprot:scaffold196267_cov32-Tisochrysis_lutea.AAC.6